MKLYDFGAAFVLFAFFTWGVMIIQEVNETREITTYLNENVTEEKLFGTNPVSNTTVL